MDSNIVIIILCSLVIFSYLFDLAARKTKVPSAMLLLALGIAMQFGAESMGYVPMTLNTLLPVLGTIGLILIVLEGALELRFSARKLRFIGQTFTVALLGMLASVALITAVIVPLADIPIRSALTLAIPLGVISSAIAIPSVQSMRGATREFIIYESSFSDILGVIAFNFVEKNDYLDFGSLFALGSELILILVITVTACLLILYVLGHITHHVKFFLLITILIFIYALGKSIHLPSLVVVLLFGLFLNNTDLIRHPKFKKLFMYEGFRGDLHSFSQLTAESAFLIRTFFFLIFGFTMDLGALAHFATALNGVIVLIIIFAVRYGVLKIFAPENQRPEVFVAPRGLISILLFLSIPASLHIPGFGSGLLFFVVLATSIIMSVGLINSKQKGSVSPVPNPEAIIPFEPTP